MPVFHHDIFIARPPQEVFAAVADVRTHPKWQAGLIRTESPHAEPQAGRKGIEVRRMFGREMSLPYEITHYDPPNQWGFRALEGPIRPSALLSFAPEQTGTRLRSKLTIPGLAGFLIGRAMLSQQRRNYAQLKTLLEQGLL